MNMDTFLRLKDPLRHGRNVTACSLLLWLGAPWAVSLVQSVAQFMLSQADADSRARPGLCFIADKNFVILGTLFSFVIPSFVAISFAALCRHEIRALKGRILCSTGLTSEAQAHTGSEGAGSHCVDAEEEEEEEDRIAADYDESLNASDSTCSGAESDNRSESLSVRNLDRASVITEQVQLEMVSGGGGPAAGEANDSQSRRTTTTRHSAAAAATATRDSSVESNCDDTTAFCDDRNGLQQQQQTEEPYNGVHMIEHSDSCNAILLLQSRYHDSADCHHLMGIGCGGQFSRSTPNNVVDDFRNIPDQTLRQELAISWLAALMMTVHIVLWLPLSISNVVYGVCQPCRDAMTFTGAVTFKWLAYSSAAVATVVYAQFSESMRQVYWNILSCRYCRLRHRGLP